jgi:ribonuclease P protein component
MRFTLRFAEKLHSQKDFQQILKSGRKLVHPALFIYVRPAVAGKPMSRMGLITGRKVGIAADRNRVKRRLREIFRLNKNSIKPNSDIIFVPRSPAVAMNYKQLESVVFSLLCKAGILE